jgi:hypothetical protein
MVCGMGEFNNTHQKTRKNTMETIILLVAVVWTTTTTLLGWLLLRANKQHRKAQEVKYPYE